MQLSTIPAFLLFSYPPAIWLCPPHPSPSIPIPYRLISEGSFFIVPSFWSGNSLLLFFLGPYTARISPPLLFFIWFTKLLCSFSRLFKDTNLSSQMCIACSMLTLVDSILHCIFKDSGFPNLIVHLWRKHLPWIKQIISFRQEKFK